MELSDKLMHLRRVEGELRHLGRPMTKAEVLRAMEAELGEKISHAYLCQLESGARTHMSPGTRTLLARFFKVLPGYLVSDPEGFEPGIVSGVTTSPDALRSWLAASAEELRADSQLQRILLRMARYPQPRHLFEAINGLIDAEERRSA